MGSLLTVLKHKAVLSLSFTLAFVCVQRKYVKSVWISQDCDHDICLAVAPHETVQAPSILPTTLPPVDLPVIPQETIQPPARPHDILVQPLDMPNEVANAESPSAPEETSAGSQQTSQTPLLDVNPTPTPVALRPSIAQPLDPPVLPDSNSLAQDLLSAPVIFPSPALPEEQLGPPIEYPPVQQVSPDPPPFEHPPVQPVSPDPTPSPILSLTPSPTPSPSPTVLQTSPPPSIPSPIASPPPPSLPPPPRLEEAENQSSTSSEGEFCCKQYFRVFLDVMHH